MIPQVPVEVSSDLSLFRSLSYFVDAAGQIFIETDWGRRGEEGGDKLPDDKLGLAPPRPGQREHLSPPSLPPSLPPPSSQSLTDLGTCK